MDGKRASPALKQIGKCTLAVGSWLSRAQFATSGPAFEGSLRVTGHGRDGRGWTEIP